MTAVEFATGAAAVSAVAACATAVIGALRDRRNRQPLLMAHALNVGTVGYAVMRVTNIGLGAAVAPAVIGLDHGVAFGGHIGAGVSERGVAGSAGRVPGGVVPVQASRPLMRRDGDR
jgi:hypothetical protein